jgi:pimeloyl-ACP methyl ester carboxylesterase
MSTTNFNVKHHTILGQHIRNYIHSTSSQSAEVHLSVNQYTPKTHISQPGDVTIIACHASGFPKELYEPFWDALYSYSRGRFGVRAIWMADVCNQGESGVLNEEELGNEPSDFDHARDYLCLVNHFRKEMPLPIVGLGHSMGSAVIINLATLHSRLFTALIAIEPPITKGDSGIDLSVPFRLTFRKDKWSSREEAEALFRKNPMFKSWDPAVVDRYLRHGLRPLPTAIHPDQEALLKVEDERPLTLTTTKHQEVLEYARAAYPSDPNTCLETASKKQPHVVRQGFHRPEAHQTFSQLPFLRPSVHYIVGDKSSIASSQPKHCAERLKITGTAVTGSGGNEAGRVKETVLKDGTHWIPFETPKLLADEIVGPWLEKELERWRVEEEAEMKRWEAKKCSPEKGHVDENWRHWITKMGAPAQKPNKVQATKSSKL